MLSKLVAKENSYSYWYDDDEMIHTQVYMYICRNTDRASE